MAHGTPTVASATSGAARLRPSYELVGPEELVVLSAAPSVHDPHMVQYGYHDGREQRLPPHLVRYIEPTEAEFDRQVEYDMDEQGTPPHADPDQAWLAQVNAERKQNQLDAVTCEAFEIIVDRLEKEWFALVKRIPSRFSIGARDDDDEFPDDSLCAICDDNECENLNAIVFCDGCNLAVHQDCYGIPYIPEGQWLCRKCTVSPDRPVSCVLCPNEGGAFKQTTQGTWAHLLCAMWIPETGVGNAVYMEPIDGISAIPKARWRLRCYLCNKRSGACIQCEHRSCFTAFHVMCARRVGLLSKARRSRGDEGDEGDDAPLVAYCHHHLPADEKAELRAKVRGADADDASDSDVSTRELALPKPGAHTTGESIALKSARAYNKLYSAGPLPVPNYLVNRVLEYVARIPLRRKPQTVAQIVRYWSLKRQEMRGAPLLKRLHIEPWTVGNFVDERTSALKLAKLQYLYRLREDLEKVRLLAELVRKREKAKLRQARLFQTHVVQGAMLYRQTAMRHALEQLMALDKANWFLQPVSTEDAPDYYERIAAPMDWSTIASRIASLTYTTADAMENDARLVCANALAYNTPDSAIAKAAAKIAKACDAIFAPVHAAFADASALGVEPSDAVVALLASRPEAPAPKSVAIGDANADSIVDAYLRQFYYVHPHEATDDVEEAAAAPDEASAASRPAKAPRKKPPPRTPPAAVRRSGRHATAETLPAPAPQAPAEPPAEPRVLKDMDQKDSFTYFNTGWLLPPGARRHNRPRPPPPPAKPKRTCGTHPGRREHRARAAPPHAESDEDSSLSELSTESA